MNLTALHLYEIKALAFYKMTGYLAPGKDQPAACAVNEDVRIAVWAEWCKTHAQCIDALMKAMVEVLEP